MNSLRWAKLGRNPPASSPLLRRVRFTTVERDINRLSLFIFRRPTQSINNPSLKRSRRFRSGRTNSKPSSGVKKNSNPSTRGVASSTQDARMMESEVKKGVLMCLKKQDMRTMRICCIDECGFSNTVCKERERREGRDTGISDSTCGSAARWASGHPVSTMKRVAEGVHRTRPKESSVLNGVEKNFKAPTFLGCFFVPKRVTKKSEEGDEESPKCKDCPTPLNAKRRKHCLATTHEIICRWEKEFAENGGSLEYGKVYSGSLASRSGSPDHAFYSQSSEELVKYRRKAHWY
ncbi:hypothetical protein L218DRAFT_949696 [Marasmius fiardii PR-910]|nr:hypothetical protein L218DRAFT_949696 [Marasmius fiardii PR-910]